MQLIVSRAIERKMHGLNYSLFWNLCQKVLRGGKWGAGEKERTNEEGPGAGKSEWRAEKTLRKRNERERGVIRGSLRDTKCVRGRGGANFIPSFMKQTLETVMPHWDQDKKKAEQQTHGRRMVRRWNPQGSWRTPGKREALLKANMMSILLT